MTDFYLSFQLEDAYGLRTSKRIAMPNYAEVDVGLDLIQATADAEDLLNAFDAVTKAKIVNFTLAVDLANIVGFGGILKNAALAGADITDVADYAFAVVPDVPGLQASAPFIVPAPADALFTAPASSRSLNLAAAALGTLVQQFQDTPGGEPTISDGQNTDANAGPHGNGVLSGRWASRKRSTNRQI